MIHIIAPQFILDCFTLASLVFASAFPVFDMTFLRSCLSNPIMHYQAWNHTNFFPRLMPDFGLTYWRPRGGKYVPNSGLNSDGSAEPYHE